MSRTEKFIKNTIGAAVLQSVTLAVGFIIPHVLLVHYGSEVNGLISSLTQFISYFSLLEAGLSGAVVFSLYKPLAQGQTDEISGIVAGAKRFYIQTGYFFVSSSFYLLSYTLCWSMLNILLKPKFFCSP